MKPIEVTGPWDLVDCDCFSLPPSENGKKNVVVFMDYFTKYVEAFAVHDIKASTIADIILHEIVPRHGVPRRFLTDQGSNFTSKLLLKVCELLKAEKVFTSPYHPQTDGLVERYNRTLSDMLSKLASQDKYQWEKFLPYALFAYRSTPQASTKFSPFMLLYGREPNFPIDTQILSERLVDPTFPATAQEYFANLTDTMKTFHSVALKNIQAAQKTQKEQHDKNVKRVVFEVGDIVYLDFKGIVDPQVGKLTPKQVGPYRIVKLPTPETAKITYVHNAEISVTVSRNRLLKHKPLPWSDLIEKRHAYMPGDVVLAKVARRPIWPAVVIPFSDMRPADRLSKNKVPIQFFDIQNSKHLISLPNIFTFTESNINRLCSFQRKGIAQAVRRACDQLYNTIMPSDI